MEEHWNNVRQQDEFKEPTRADLYRLINALDLRKALSGDLKDNNLFNDARNGKVRMKSNKMEVQIDYTKNKLLPSSTSDSNLSTTCFEYAIQLFIQRRSPNLQLVLHSS